MASASVLLPSSTPAAIVERGDVVEIELTENPTTGYRWTVTVTPQDFIEVERSDFEAAASGAPGAAGRRVFTFLVRGQGSGEVDLALARSWEPERPIDRLRVAIDA
jgi:inhibitor of cysteine peptidase